MTKHTAGPWERRGVYPNIFAVFGKGGDICTIPLRTQKRLRSEIEANANLIASAPELLEACKEMLGWWEEWTSAENPDLVENPNIDKLFKAITKAEGR